MRQSSPFLGLAGVLDEVRTTRGKKDKVALLAAYLRGLAPEDAETAARISTGKSSERGSKDEAQVGYSTLLAVIADMAGAGQERLSASYLRHGDLGEVAEELLADKKEQTLFREPLTLADLEEAFAGLRSAKGRGSQATRMGIVRALLLRATPLEAKYIVKVLTAEMRTGLVGGLLEEAVSSAYSVPRAEAARAHMVLGDLGTFARAAAEGRLAEVKLEPFRPVNFMLAEPMASARDVADHFGKEAYAEYKYDGVRAQAHKRGSSVRLYSRRLEEITSSFPEVVSELEGASGDFIIDGEVVPFYEGRPLPFQLLQRRLRRKEESDEAAKGAPAVYFAFDILLLDGKDLTGLGLTKRRRKLREATVGTSLRMAESVVVKDEAGIQTRFRSSRDLGYEGLVVKDPDSAYTMGRRGSSWVKLKEELDTLDAVIVAAEYGHGKRAGVISDYTFAVRDGEDLKTIGKAYSGLTDLEIDDMTARLKKLTMEDLGYRRVVKPEIVVEVAFDSVQKSGRHDSGYALRFPRIKRIRDDKSVLEVDTLQRVEAIFAAQKLKV
jgi:DNA ligase 1